MKYDVVIIGSGLGGLQCGYILSKHGLNVCVLEKGAQPGGCMQTFRRGKHTFDTGFHYVGGLDEGQPLHRLFDYFGLMDLPWRRMDENGFDEVIIDNKSYLFANGYEHFTETLSRQFPHQHRHLKKYADFLRHVSDHIFGSFEKKEVEDMYGTSLFAKSAYDYLTSTIDDPLLRDVLSGTSLKMELNPKTLPLYIFAQINSSFIQSAWRLQGGGSQIAGSLIKSIETNGGTVRMNAEVTRLIEANGRIVAAEVNGISGGDGSFAAASFNSTSGTIVTDSRAERIEADYFIANTHPAAALSLITDSKLVRNIYRKRINNLENTFGMFTANIVLKENTIPYQNRNLYVYKTGDVWQYADYHPDRVNTCAL
ncbi:MAG TPA: NAD(P)/FAD-dependent oxidoreductase, partial [Porphyromonadaceae bacterium]|nr:NAD(P)/FAD-dependent oxidoreductase [Porphyromonadaceae bacterium]